MKIDLAYFLSSWLYFIQCGSLNVRIIFKGNENGLPLRLLFINGVGDLLVSFDLPSLCILFDTFADHYQGPGQGPEPLSVW